MPDTARRAIDLLVLSDVHLGTRSCRAQPLADYLAGIAPAEIILNGDIVDLREMRRKHWPAAHTAVVRQLLGFAAEGVPVSYVTGNHDESLRHLSAWHGGPIRLVDQVERVLDGRRTWFLHGDLLEQGLGVGRIARWAGCMAYRATRVAERAANGARDLLGAEPVALIRRLKGCRSALAHIARYEEACAAFADRHGFDAIVTGHIHRANIRHIPGRSGAITYLNSGDWVDSCTALEYRAGRWRLVSPTRADACAVGDHAAAAVLATC